MSRQEDSRRAYTDYLAMLEQRRKRVQAEAKLQEAEVLEEAGQRYDDEELLAKAQAKRRLAAEYYAGLNLTLAEEARASGGEDE